MVQHVLVKAPLNFVRRYLLTDLTMFCTAHVSTKLYASSSQLAQYLVYYR
jgi:hypothetical protein